MNNFANWGMDAHNKIIRKYFKLNSNIQKNISNDDLKYFRKFYGMDEKNQRIFLTKNINHLNLRTFLEDSAEFNNKLNITIFFFIK